MSENPYAAPQTFDTPSAPDGEAGLIRKEHIKTEASIKSIGTLYYLACSIASLSLFGMISNGGTFGGGLVELSILFIILLLFFTARAIRKFRPWARIVVGILSSIAVLSYIASGVNTLSHIGTVSVSELLGMSIGLLINGYILRLIFGKKGRMVFSAPYQEIIAATPHIKYRTPKIVWIILGILVAVVTVLIASVAFGN